MSNSQERALSSGVLDIHCGHGPSGFYGIEILGRIYQNPRRAFLVLMAMFPSLALPVFIFMTVASAPIFAASAYPDKNVMMVVPFPAGGRSDITMRLLGPYLEKEFGTSLVILNKPGGGSSNGFKYLAQTQPDGYTLGLNTNAVITAQYTVKENLDLRNYEPVALINSDPAVIAVGSNGRWQSIAALVKFAKENPKKLLIGINPGASAHIFAASFLKVAKIEATLVPYKGGSERVAALAGGHIDADFGVMAQYRPMIETKRVRVIAVASAKRMSDNKEIPTFLENGINFQISGWQGFFVPKGVQPSIKKRIDAGIKTVLTNPEVVNKLSKIEINVDYMPPNEFAEFLKKEDADMRILIKELGLMVASPK
jgi:tripartite-type tricarboxylate transporter receptor subunit TctC